jgi:hypothetical protein
MLHGGVADPVDAGIIADGVVVGVHADNLEVLEHSVRVHPVGVENAKVAVSAANAAFGHDLQTAGGLEVVDTVVLGLAVNDALVRLALAATTADGNTDDAVALLLLVTEATGPVGAGRAVARVDDIELAVLPGADTLEEAKDVGLLLLPDFGEVFVGALYK